MIEKGPNQGTDDSGCLYSFCSLLRNTAPTVYRGTAWLGYNRHFQVCESLPGYVGTNEEGERCLISS